jgi:hypothetical protein
LTGPARTGDALRRGVRDQEDGGVAQDTIPKLSGDVRPLIPKLGLRNYWYPAVNDRAVGGRKPVKRYDSPENVPLSRVSVRYFQEQMKKKAVAAD